MLDFSVYFFYLHFPDLDVLLIKSLACVSVLFIYLTKRVFIIYNTAYVSYCYHVFLSRVIYDYNNNKTKRHVRLCAKLSFYFPSQIQILYHTVAHNEPLIVYSMQFSISYSHFLSFPCTFFSRA